MKLIASPPISPYQPIAKGTNSLVKPSKGTKFAHAGEFLFFSSALSRWLSTARMFVPWRVSGAWLVRSNTILTLSSKALSMTMSGQKKLLQIPEPGIEPPYVPDIPK